MDMNDKKESDKKDRKVKTKKKKLLKIYKSSDWEY